MKHRTLGISLAVAVGAMMLTTIAPTAEAASAQTFAPLAPLALDHQSTVEQAHWRRGYRRCHWVKRCWWNHRGYRRCGVFRRCGW
ncbi:hypothetical protein [Ralstonia sp.]|uniref:hypothetical protein n=1 Tax=Ralstonia sp. TaxID=54061 RepID=UPI000D4EBA6E|nr:hypothetical protein [Ralstonia sp.]PPD31004.1 MAG: hypothetical protein CTY20_01150 [Hyphomicrobium sp.]